MSFLLTLNGTGSNSDNFSTTFTPSIELDETLDYECALVKLNLWYSWYNVSSAKGNNTLTYNNGATDRSVTFPDGQYTVNNLNDELHRQMKAFGDVTISGTTEIYDIELSPNYATNKVSLTLDNSYTIDFSDNGNSDLYLLLGFATGDYSFTGTQDAPNIANLNDDINVIVARTSLVEGGGSYVDGNVDNALITFVPDQQPGTNIEVIPRTKIFLPMESVKGQYISNVRCSITDQLDRRVNLNGEPMTFLLEIRPTKQSILRMQANLINNK